MKMKSERYLRLKWDPSYASIIKEPGYEYEILERERLDSKSMSPVIRTVVEGRILSWTWKELVPSVVDELIGMNGGAFDAVWIGLMPPAMPEENRKELFDKLTEKVGDSFLDGFGAKVIHPFSDADAVKIHEELVRATKDSYEEMDEAVRKSWADADKIILD